MRLRKTSLFRAAAAVISLSAASGAFAQSCAMCYTSAAASGDKAIGALRHGILILLAPPLLIFVGICVATFRSREGEPP